MPVDQLPSPPDVIHVPVEMIAVESMTRAARHEISAAAGESISDALKALRADADYMLQRIADIQAAWSEHDWGWLADAGVISRRMEAQLITADLADD